MPLESGDLLHGRYRVLAAISVGGMGSVWGARDEVTQAPRVIKQLRLDAPELLDAFRGEYALLSRLSHRHLVRVIDFGSARLRGELLHYYVAEQIEGRTLRDHAQSAALTGAVLLRPILDALEGLSVLHEARLRHGDFTPSNVIVRSDGTGVLIDLGLTRPFGLLESVAGTEGFIAPELVQGASGDARSDSYAVGVTLRRCFESARLAPPSEVARLIERACREDPVQRPADAREMLEALGRRTQLSERLAVPAELVGRRAEIAQFETWFAALDEHSSPRVLCLSAAPGMGSSRLFQELLSRVELDVAVLRAHGGEAGAIGRLLGAALQREQPVDSVNGLLAALPALLERSERLLLFVEDHERLETGQRELLLSFVRLIGESSSLALVLSGHEPLPGVVCDTIAIGPLSLAATRDWTRGLLSEEHVQALHRETGGSPARLETALRNTDRASPTRSARDGELDSDQRTKAAISRLQPAARALLALLVVLGGELTPGAELATWQDFEPLVEAGLVVREAERARLRHDATRVLEDGLLSPNELSRAHSSAAKWRLSCEVPPEPSVRFALAIAHLAQGGQLAHAEALYEQMSREFLPRARSTAKPLLALATRTMRAELTLQLSEVLLAGGLPRAALRAAARTLRLPGGRSLLESATLRVSEALVRLGRPARAEMLLGRYLTRAASAPEIAERLARARLSRGDYRGAAETAQGALGETATAELEGRLRETIGVALAYLGDLEGAERELAAAWSLLATTSGARERCRIQSHRATVAFRAGRIEAALTDYAGALGLAEQADLDDLVATGLLNLGTAEQQAGAWGSALRHYQRGVLFARAIGRETTELTLEFNLANLYVELGAFERAEQRLQGLQQRAQGARLTHFRPAIFLVRAEIRLILGEPDVAEELLEQAAQRLSERAQPRELFEIELRRAEAALQRGDWVGATERSRALHSASKEPALGELRLSLAALEARLIVARGESFALSGLHAARQEAEREGLLPLQASLETTLFELLEARAELDAARTHGERARRLWDRISAELPEAFAATFWRHPKRARVAELSRATHASGVSASVDAEPYRRLLSLNRRLNSSLSTARILEYAVQSAVELSGAERGFLLEASPTDDPGLSARLSVRVQSEPVPGAGEGPSQSIVRRTFEREEPILTTDAQGDPRFRAQGSVHSLRLKSVLSVPILSPSGVLGVLYVDSRVQRARFSSRDRDLLLAFADQLALALGNARLHDELAQKNAEILKQKLAVEQLARGQAREIVRLKREVESQRQSLSLRYDYSQIVGRGPAMRAVLGRLDRIVDSQASVLVLGESGTGKELVARALHFNGPRKAGPFLGINCAALPENLLESELFGHVRGAFTGADRDKPGLMQAASGGTLFLDEVGELPLTTQAKLLRVLQEREVRPLGATRAEPLDIRLIAATHRDLPNDLSSGRFREDLYYRIAVVSVELPPLRERLEDLPALASKILEQLAREAGKKPPELTQDALRKLSAHRFPGNVRELQNVLTRAFVLSGSERLREGDIELAVSARKRGTRATTRNDFESQERQRILEALQQARWNVSVVSRALGIPRNTLYRKLTRYGLERTQE